MEQQDADNKDKDAHLQRMHSQLTALWLRNMDYLLEAGETTEHLSSEMPKKDPWYQMAGQDNQR